MSVSKKIPVGEHRLRAQYLELCEKLTTPEYAQHLGKRLAFWTNPLDKRLPIILLGKTLDEILSIPFDDLTRYPSIGEKKLGALITLLNRAVATSIGDLPMLDQQPFAESEHERRAIQNTNDVFLNTVSELQWNSWQRLVLEQGLGHEKIGRLCSSLAEMPRVLWHKTLRTYCWVSLSELRNLKTHGEKRVLAILRLFYDIAQVASRTDRSPHLKIHLSLRWIDEVENWIKQVLEHDSFPVPQEVYEHLIVPLLEQLRVDASDNVVQLAETRLGLRGPITSVRQVAKEMNIARARVYQLLNEISDIFQVRWEGGAGLIHQLWDKFIREMLTSPAQDEYEQFIAAAELFYPAGKRATLAQVDDFRDVAQSPGSFAIYKPR